VGFLRKGDWSDIVTKKGGGVSFAFLQQSIGNSGGLPIRTWEKKLFVDIKGS